MSIDRADKPWIGDRRLTEGRGTVSAPQHLSLQASFKEAQVQMGWWHRVLALLLCALCPLWVLQSLHSYQQGLGAEVKELKLLLSRQQQELHNRSSLFLQTTHSEEERIWNVKLAQATCLSCSDSFRTTDLEDDRPCARSVLMHDPNIVRKWRHDRCATCSCQPLAVPGAHKVPSTCVYPVGKQQCRAP